MTPSKLQSSFEHAWVATRKISYETAKREYALAVVNAKMNIENLEFLNKIWQAEEIEKLRAAHLAQAAMWR